ncbi:helix-turn-helix domain-containing protein [Spongiimicrobium sp. 3-5]|uniref:helix-turn-helix domain-containing protein n=1 Tax=Spongiimicrobium sp. 3-5 TaxID=3332596 RepID=UPI00397F7C5C
MYPKIYLYKRIKDAKILIDRNYSNKLDLDHIAKKVHLSKYHFLRLFKEAYGITPHKYLISKRLEAAEKMLLTDLPIFRICNEVGFESVHSFSNLFKRYRGKSPSNYRKSLRKD